MTTALYYTDSKLDPEIAVLAWRYLVQAAQGRPIVAVAQQPMPAYPDAIVVGDLPRNAHSMYAQIVRGLEAVQTDTVAFCEHDCFYPAEHLDWTPPNPRLAWYNEHTWYVNWPRRHRRYRHPFTYRYHHPLSSLVMATETARRIFSQRYYAAEHLLNGGRPRFAALSCGWDMAFGLLHAEPGMLEWRTAFDDTHQTCLAEGYPIDRVKAKRFRTHAPVLDIRHGGNLTRQKNWVTWADTLDSWGTLADIRRGPMDVGTPDLDTLERQLVGDGNGMTWPSYGDTMIGPDRMANLRACVETVLRDAVPGDFIETGVWRGGACIWMRALLKAHGVTDRVVWAADSFEGLPKPDVATYPKDRADRHYRSRVLRVSLETVKDNFHKYGLLDDQVRFLKGWFKDTLPTAPIERLAILRLDGDLYQSTMEALVALYPKVSPGGYVIVDDWFRHACRSAVRDYRKRHGIHEPLEDIKVASVMWRKAA